MNQPMYPGQALSGLPDDYYDYGAGSTFDETLSPSEQASVDAARRHADAERWSRAREDVDGS